MEIVKECPHCGGSARLSANFSHKTHCWFIFVRCDICGSQGKPFGSRINPADKEWSTEECADAVNAWNMRKGEN